MHSRSTYFLFEMQMTFLPPMVSIIASWEQMGDINLVHIVKVTTITVIP